MIDPKTEHFMDDVEILTGDVRRRDEMIQSLRTRLAESEAEVERHRDEHGKRSEAWLKERQRALAAERSRDEAREALMEVLEGLLSGDEPDAVLRKAEIRAKRVLSGEKEGA